ncbi:MAG: class I SAM-dependent RNA methyltransferase [Acidobacteria bacterium]|nr:class I SAM-dependent RNA methyltransferase [Acidobacteriota bacterium]
MSVHTVGIEKVVPGGDGLGRLPDGRVVFVPFTLPGERVRVRVVAERRSVAFGSLEDVLEASPGRRDAPCPHFGECGGCRLQHADPGLQVQLKTSVLAEIWRGRVPVEQGCPPGDAFGYRHRVRLHVTPGNRGVGFMRHRSNAVVPVTDCLLCRPEIRRCIRWLREDFLPRLSPGRWPLREIRLAMGDGPPVYVLPAFARPVPVRRLREALGRSARPASGEWVVAGPGPGAGRAEGPGAGGAALAFRLGPYRYEADPGGFFQANLPQAGRVLERLGEQFPPSVPALELFCGMGLFTVVWGSRSPRVVAVEGDRLLRAPFERTLRLNGLGGVTLATSPVEAWLREHRGETPAFGWLFLDPPRTGLSPEARELLRGPRPGTLAYLSCDPVTQHRDLVAMAPGAAPRLLFYDFFPNTAHLECLALLTEF